MTRFKALKLITHRHFVETAEVAVSVAAVQRSHKRRCGATGGSFGRPRGADGTRRAG